MGILAVLADEDDGVIRPLVEGVTLPLEKVADGVRDEENEGVTLPDNARVVLPPQEEATDGGR